MAHDVLRAWALIKNSPAPLTLPEACDEVDRRAANEAPTACPNCAPPFRCWDCHGDELARIRETLAQTWPRCGGHTPSAAEDWHREGFDDEAVQHFLEVGVPFVWAALSLDVALLDTSDLRHEHEDGVTLGLAYARGELSIAEVQRIVLGGEVEG